MKSQPAKLREFIRTALISPCGLYRYYLTRTWAPGPRMVFVMLNPSKADANIDDQTVLKCVGFAERFGCGSIAIVNLFAFRATDPKDLAAAGYLAGPDNDFWLLSACVAADHVVYAWGANASKPPIGRQAWHVSAMLGRHVDAPLCIARTAEGYPQHPCMAPYAPLIPY